MATIDVSGGISFFKTRTAYIAASQTNASGNTNLQDTNNDIKLSDFINATFVHPTGKGDPPPDPVPSGNISMKTVFKTGDDGNKFE